jgi:hypothetical protein
MSFIQYFAIKKFVFLPFYSKELHHDWTNYFLAFDCFVHIKQFFQASTL